jgi:hypothetical protein
MHLEAVGRDGYVEALVRPLEFGGVDPAASDAVTGSLIAP